jgi:hypothetical protein
VKKAATDAKNDLESDKPAQPISLIAIPQQHEESSFSSFFAFFAFFSAVFAVMTFLKEREVNPFRESLLNREDEEEYDVEQGVSHNEQCEGQVYYAIRD